MGNGAHQMGEYARSRAIAISEFEVTGGRPKQRKWRPVLLKIQETRITA